MNRKDYILYGAKAMAARGSDLPHAKLDEEKARYVKRNPHGMTARQLAELFGVHIRTIEKIREGYNWVSA